jgi:Ser-tRNA(Ala) deacylase AlaX
MADPLTSRTQPLYQKDSELHTHTSPITSLTPLSSFPPTTQSLFKPSENSTALILTTSATIFHAQGGGQPSDTGSIRTASATFHVHQVRAPGEGGAILHMGTLDGEGGIVGEEGAQSIDVEKRTLHSRLHTAGHVLGLAVHELVAQGKLDPGLKDGKASHYPGAAYVEFAGLIPGSAKEDIQRTVDGTLYHLPCRFVGNQDADGLL